MKNEKKDKRIDSIKQNKSEKGRSFRMRIAGIISVITLIGIFTFVIINYVKSGNNHSTISGQAESGSEGDTETSVQHQVSKEKILDKALNRPNFEPEDLNGMPIHQIFNEKLEVHLPRGWSVSESGEADEIQIQMIGNDSEQMNLLLFTEAYKEDTFDAQLSELIDTFEATEEVTVSVDELIEKLSANSIFPLPYQSVLPFDIDDADITVFYNEKSRQIMEVYVSELFGYQMIFTSQFSYDDDDSWNNSMIFFTYMFPGYPFFEIHGSAGEIHPVYNRPVEKDVLLQVGAIGVERVEVELFESDELELTSYVSKNMDIQRKEHEHFVEWRFTEQGIPGESFIAFGKLKDGFPLEQDLEIMFEAHDIDLTHYVPSEPDAPLSNFYSYQDYTDGNIIDGYFHLFEEEGEWYYNHYHGEFSEYNGGTYSQRLEMFLDSIEWY